MTDRPSVPLSEPSIGGNAGRYLQECLDTNYVSSVGPFVERFEREFAAYLGAGHAVACASGTAAIHVALRVLGVRDGDEVFVPTLTFVASANPVLYERATPVLVDSEEETWNLDPELVVEEIERRARSGRRQPRVVEAVHLLGHPARLETLAETCARHGIALLEDASEALGARYLDGPLAGRHVGTLGRMGCFSFNGNKIITTGGGGMIVTDDAELARRAKHLTTQARIPGLEYWHDEVGYNYRLSNLAAALGVAQLEQLPAFLESKRAIARRYDDALGGVAGISRAPRAPWAAPSFWLYTVGVDESAFGRDRRGLMESLRAGGFEARPIWSPLHRMPMYRDAPRLGGERAERLFARALSLPSSVGLRAADQDGVARAIQAQGRTPARAHASRKRR
jgi:aminotransferase in exopolysaccharide biosynthesis